MTVDTAHVVVTGSTTRENFYVSMTRGRESNIAYVALDKPDESHAAPEPDEVTAQTVLFGVLQHSGVELSAHQTIEAEQEHWSSIAQTRRRVPHHRAPPPSATAGSRRSGAVGLTDDQVDAGADLRLVRAAHRRAAPRRVRPATTSTELLPSLVAQRSLDDAEDIGAVLISRLQKAARPKQEQAVARPRS